MMAPTSPSPIDSEVHVWWTRPESWQSPDLVRRFSALLSDDERDRCQRFVFPSDRRTYTVAHALVRTVLSSYTGIDPAAWQFTAGRYGRPEISGPPGAPHIRFSLGHTKGLAALAVSRIHDVGVDVEHRDRQTDCLGLARQFFASVEADHLASLPPPKRATTFFDYWTLKEAYVKATGLGLSLPLASFWFQLGEPPTVVFATDSGERSSDWHFEQLSFGSSHAGAVAVRAGPVRPSISVRKWMT